MTHITRRRFLSISAAASVVGGSARAGTLRQWRGIALGAEASITLQNPDADWLIKMAIDEIERLENVFSLYRADSDLSRLNRDGLLDAPDFDLLQCLELCAEIHQATGGLFDPTIQPLWAFYAKHYAAGSAPDKNEIAAARQLVGFSDVQFSAQAIRLHRPGMALSLNGIAQGYIADKVAQRMRTEGLKDVLVNTGELQAVGSVPNGAGSGWTVSLAVGGRLLRDAVVLRDRALASSAPLGTAFDDAGHVGHILDPRSGVPSDARWQLVSVSAPRAAVADGLSTAGCMQTRKELTETISRFAGARLEYLV
jgi:thiamine biosynthesis lipoprotein